MWESKQCIGRAAIFRIKNNKLQPRQAHRPLLINPAPALIIRPSPDLNALGSRLAVNATLLHEVRLWSTNFAQALRSALSLSSILGRWSIPPNELSCELQDCSWRDFWFQE
jgi:hypothetical protein